MQNDPRSKIIDEIIRGLCAGLGLRPHYLFIYETAEHFEPGEEAAYGYSFETVGTMDTDLARKIVSEAIINNSNGIPSDAEKH